MIIFDPNCVLREHFAQWYLAHGAGAARSSGSQPNTSRSLVDLAQSFFVGDAAGRPGDHSNVDSGFAATVGLRFMTPEECFRGSASNSSTGTTSSSSRSNTSMPSSNEGHGGIGSSGPHSLPFPSEAVKAAVALAFGPSTSRPLPAAGATVVGQERATAGTPGSSISGSSGRPILLMLCGVVGSGKSTWAANLMVRSNASRAATITAAGPATLNAAAHAAAASAQGNDWVVVCQDVLKSRAKCEKVCAGALAAGQSVVVDRTNLTAEQRASFVEHVLTAVPRQVGA